jgi:hypothetical protein
VKWTVAISFFSITGHKLVGLLFIRRFSAASRAVIDQVRNVFIWAYSLAGRRPYSVHAHAYLPLHIYCCQCCAVGWETFHWLELVGFMLVLLGNGVYYELFSPKRLGQSADQEATASTDWGTQINADKLKNGIN